MCFHELWRVGILWTREEIVKFSKWSGTYSGYWGAHRSSRKYRQAATVELCVQRAHGARPRLYWCTGRTCYLRDTVRFQCGVTEVCVYRVPSSFATFRVRRSRGEMYIGNGRLFACLSVPRRILTPLHGPGCNLGNGRGCCLVVHYWTDLQSVHGFRSYDNTHACKLIALYTASAYCTEREMSASVCKLYSLYGWLVHWVLL